MSNREHAKLVRVQGFPALSAHADPAKRALTVACLTGALWGCGASAEGWDADEQQGESDLGTIEQDISGGSLTNSFGSVFKLFLGNGFCTASKIGPFKFMTAAHCFREAGVNPATVTTLDVTSKGDGATSIFHLAVPGGVQIHPSAVIQNTFPQFDETYDVAVFTTTTSTTGDPMTISSAGENLSVPVSAFSVGYGADALDPSHNGKKQSAFYNLNIKVPLTVKAELPLGAASPVTGSGDSGSPLLRASDFQILGVGSYGGLGGSVTNPNSQDRSISAFSRVANVVDWINDPTPTNTNAIFQQNAVVRFIHNKKNGSFPVGLCLTQRVNAIELLPCRGPFGKEVSPSQAPGWMLLATPAAGHFAIVNREYFPLCLTTEFSPANGSALAAGPCDVNKPAQQWQFQLTTASPFNTLRIKNKANGLCVGTGGGLTSGTAVTQSTCVSGSTADSVQSWLASR